MSSSRSRLHSFPVAPPSPSAGGHAMRDYPAADDVARPFPESSQALPSSQTYFPYLGLRARLSQVWINRWTILLLLVLVRTLLAIASLDDNLANAREKALSACTSVENVGSAMASMPHYLSDGVNELSADGLEKAINGLIRMLTLSVTGVEELVVFVINLLISTYVCLITFAVGGSLHIAIDVAETVGDFLNQTAKDIGQDLGKAADGLQTTLNGFISGVDKIGDFFSGKSTPAPKVDFTSQIDELNALRLPSGYDQGLAKLNASIPTFAEVKNFTDNAIRFPFETVKKLLNDSLPTYSLDRSLFVVPEKEQLTFCSDGNGINDFFDNLVQIERVARKIFLAVLIVAAVLVCVPMAWREVQRWKKQQRYIRLVQTDAVDSIDAAYIISRPYTAGAGISIANKCAGPRRKAMVRFSVAYATTVPALFVLSLALAGLFSCLCQYILLLSLEKEVPGLTSQVGSFADKVYQSLNNASTQWAIGTNHIINQTNAKINEDVFGWVNTTTGAMNDTLNVFVDGMMTALNVTFGGTALYDPVLEVLNCLVLLKVQGIENALTWVSDNAYISFPELPQDTFSLGAASKIVQNGNNSLLATGPAQDASDAISESLLRVLQHLRSGIREEAIISSCVLLVWVVIVLVGIAHSIFMSSRPSETLSSSFDEKHEYPRTSSTRSKSTGAGEFYAAPELPASTNLTPTIRMLQPTTTRSKLGTVGSRLAGLSLQGGRHNRASSHANLDSMTPVEPGSSGKSPIAHRSHDPLGDPRRETRF